MFDVDGQAGLLGAFGPGVYKDKFVIAAKPGARQPIKNPSFRVHGGTDGKGPQSIAHGLEHFFKG